VRSGEEDRLGVIARVDAAALDAGPDGDAWLWFPIRAPAFTLVLTFMGT
jgi:hypothetical protein